MRKDPFAIIIIKWVCWAFVVGVGIANIIGQQEHEFMLKMWVLCSTFFFLSVYLYFSSKELVKYALIPAFVILGLASYQYRFDTSNTDHIKNFKDNAKWSQTLIRGVVVKDPDVRNKITHVVIKPEEIIEKPQKSDNARILKGKTGYVILFISEKISRENEYYERMEYGDRVEVVGFLTEPMPLRNPYGFNYAKYLLNKNIYVSMYVGKPGNIKYLGKSKLNKFGVVKKLAFRLKDKMILGLKKTIPPPYSAFVGGVTIGARGGVPEVIKNDFQATGVAHVLALSGLHVGFIAVVLVMLCNNIFKSSVLFYKLPSKLAGKELDLTPYSRKMIPVFVVAILLIFVVITGARPATIRAAMMYSIGIIFYFFLDMNIRQSGSVTIPMSAAIMLACNSFLIYDASFALSFTAVWSIIYLTGPLREIFSRLIVGWGQMVFFLFFMSVIPVLVVMPALFASESFVVIYLSVFAVLSAGAYVLEKRYPLTGIEFEGWWPYISGFFCVQLSIQIGMMWPLSGVYFGRFPVAGMLANFIAIPLIGLIVPLGLLGELFTLVPLIGEHIGLAIGGANVIFSGFFLLMARFFRLYFPYPVQSIPSTKGLVVYYLMVVSFAFNKEIRKFIVNKFRLSNNFANFTVAGVILFIFSAGYLGGEAAKSSVRKKNEMLITFFDVGYGNSALIQTPQGKAILIDAGIRGDRSYWSMGKWGKGASVILPALAGYKLSKVDKMVTTNPLPENIGGLIYILQHFRVSEVWDTLNPEFFKPELTYDDFLDGIGDVRLKIERDSHAAIGSYLNYYDFRNTKAGAGNGALREKSVVRKWLHEGVVIHSETAGGKRFELKALNPPVERIGGTENDLLNNSAVLKLTYGDRVIIFTSNILVEAEDELVSSYCGEIKADIITIPDHGSSMASSSGFLEKIRPAFAVVQYGYLKNRSCSEVELKRTLRRYKNMGVKVYRTDKVGAVEVRCDGRKMDVVPVTWKKR